MYDFSALGFWLCERSGQSHRKPICTRGWVHEEASQHIAVADMSRFAVSCTIHGKGRKTLRPRSRKHSAQLRTGARQERIGMMNRRTFIHLFTLAGAALLLSACVSTGATVGHTGAKGPPPHAPAHGYRRKNRHGIEMTFDSHLGVYALLNYPMHFYLDGNYYRKSKNKWESSKDIHRKWKSIKKQELPKGLQNK